MIQSLWSAASGMHAQQLKVDTVANNLANLNTTGYKVSRVTFQDLAYMKLADQTAAAATGSNQGGTAGSDAGKRLQIGTGVGPGTVVRDFSPGVLEVTGRPFDLAIDGRGFFQVKLSSNETAYTRDGGFGVSPSGSGSLLVDPAGNPVLNRSGQTITIPADITRVEVDRQGNVTAYLASGTTQSCGQIGIAIFTNDAGLENIGQNLYRKTDASGTASVDAPGSGGRGQVLQGSLEGSNVQVVAEVVNLIVAQRAYELSSKAVQSSDQMLEIANNLRR